MKNLDNFVLNHPVTFFVGYTGILTTIGAFFSEDLIGVAALSWLSFIIAFGVVRNK